MKLIKNIIILLLTFSFIAIIVHAIGEWTQYGMYEENYHFTTSILAEEYDDIINTINITKGQGYTYEMIVEDFAGDSDLEVLVWDDTSIYLYNLSSGSLIHQYNINSYLYGNPIYYAEKLHAIVLFNGDSKQYYFAIDINSSSFNVTQNVSVGDAKGQGVRCTGGYCIFMNKSNTIFRVDYTASTSTYDTYDFWENGTHSNNRTPSIGDIDGDGDDDAVFIVVNTSTSNRLHVIVYDIQSNQLVSTFGNNGIAVTSVTNCQRYSNPVILDFDGGNPEIAVVYSSIAANARLTVWDSSGTEQITHSVSGDRDIFTQPVISQCSPTNTYDTPIGVLYLARENGNNDFQYSFVYYQMGIGYTSSSSLSSHIANFGLNQGSMSAETNYNELVADSYTTYDTELLIDLNDSLVILNCTDATVLSEVLPNNDISGGQGIIGIDYDGDYYIDFILFNEDKMEIFTSNSTNSPPVITELHWDTCSPTCYSGSITYSVSYTDSELNSIAMSVDCFGNGTMTGWSSYSANPTVTCNMTMLGTFEPVIYISDTIGENNDSITRDTATCGSPLVVQIASCYDTGETDGLCQQICSVNGTVSYTVGGVYTNASSDVFGYDNFSNYDSLYFDTTECSSWTGAREIFVAFCPLWILIKLWLGDIWDWIFSQFWLFLALILVIIVIGYFKLKKGN